MTSSPVADITSHAARSSSTESGSKLHPNLQTVTAGEGGRKKKPCSLTRAGKAVEKKQQQQPGNHCYRRLLVARCSDRINSWDAKSVWSCHTVASPPVSCSLGLLVPPFLSLQVLSASLFFFFALLLSVHAACIGACFTTLAPMLGLLALTLRACSLAPSLLPASLPASLYGTVSEESA